MENGNYTVEPRRPSKPRVPVALRSRVAQVRKFFGGKNVNVSTPGSQLGPVEPRADYARLHVPVHSSLQQDVSASIEHAHGVALGDPARSGIGPVDFQQAHVFHSLRYRKIRKGGI